MTTLYHGTPHRGIITVIDPGVSKMDEHGKGFYMGVEMHRAKEIGGWNAHSGGKGGFIYSMEVPEIFDSYASKHGERFLVSSVPVDDQLIKRLADAMRKLGTSPENGKDFAEAADKLEDSQRKGHYRDFSTKDLVKQIQNLHGIPSASKPGALTSHDVFEAAGIAGLHAQTNNSIVIIVPTLLPPLRIEGYQNPQDPQASAIGKTIERMNDIAPPLHGDTDREIRKLLAEAVLDAEKKDPAAYDKVKLARGALENCGATLPPNLSAQLEMAENTAGVIAGKSLQELADISAAKSEAAQRPERAKGEGFEHYKQRVYAWYDANNPNATEGQQQAFNSALHDTLYRDVQKYYASVTADGMAINGKPLRLEEMLKNNGTRIDRDFVDIAYIEDDCGRYHSSDEFKANPKVPPHGDDDYGRKAAPPALAVTAAAAMPAATAPAAEAPKAKAQNLG